MGVGRASLSSSIQPLILALQPLPVSSEYHSPHWMVASAGQQPKGPVLCLPPWFCRGSSPKGETPPLHAMLSRPT